MKMKKSFIVLCGLMVLHCVAKTADYQKEVIKRSAESLYQFLDNQKIATFVMPSFLAKGLTTSDLEEWKKLTEAANAVALRQASNQQIKNAIAQLPSLLDYITSSIAILHEQASTLSSGELLQKATQIKAKQKIADQLLGIAWTHIMPLMYPQWDQNAPKLQASKVLSKEQKMFIEGYRTLSKNGVPTLTDVKRLLGFSDIATLPANMASIATRDKFALSKPIGDLLLNLENYAYLLSTKSRYKATTSRAEKIIAAKQAAESLQVLFEQLPPPAWRTTLFAKVSDKAIIALVAQASAYRDILGQLYQEVFARSNQ